MAVTQVVNDHTGPGPVVDAVIFFVWLAVSHGSLYPIKRSPRPSGRQNVAVVHTVGVDPDADLFEIIGTHNGFCRFLCPLKTRQQDGNEQRNDRDDDQQFDKGKRWPPMRRHHRQSSTGTAKLFNHCRTLPKHMFVILGYGTDP